MSQNGINWSKAPSGATHYNPQDQLHPWRAVNGTNVAVYEYGVWRNFVARPDLVALYIPRPIEVTQWGGTGLPPTGLLVEWSEGAGSKPRRVTVLAYANGDAWIQPEEGESIIVGNPAGFRPIRTPEQIAAEEREAAIASMLAVDEYDPASALGMMSRHDFCGVLYDLGYRKPGAPTFFGIDYSQDVMTQNADLRAALTELDAAISAARFEDPSHDRIHRALNTARDLLAKIESEKAVNTAQKAAIKALEAAFLLLARSKLVMVGVDDNLIVTVDDDELEREIRNSSSPEAITARNNRGHEVTTTIKHRGVYLDSGAT